MYDQRQYFRQRLNGLSGGALWGLDTVLIGLILAHGPFQYFAGTAPLIATFLHDSFSAMVLLILNIISNPKNYIFNFLRILKKSPSAHWVMFAAVFGGPVGMTGYALSIHYIGPTYTAIISAMYPAFGALLNFIVFRQRPNLSTIVGLSLAIGGTIFTGMSATITTNIRPIGFIFAALCVIGWGSESVISAYGMKNDLSSDDALQIRQLISGIVFAVGIIPIVPSGYHHVFEIFHSPIIFLLLLTAIAGSLSYKFYYGSINVLGAVQAMGLNISYSAWAIVIGIVVGNKASLTSLLLASIIILGSVLTADSKQLILRKIPIVARMIPKEHK
ncbi:hypothetical protein LROSL1_0895 [Furfurilactobacillus rossiae]|uniref:DMT family transporter n=1 Tax=Furfurilactobacillus rossiae TaxID=231049 RepID=UPI0015BA90C2|nr:DMT family transporter [Furfurilactobacillus rossiae]MCF6165354.1 DMT family transporter [Furfurilactobacillus rossiae]QLE63714.1 hypothetical protein LROSL1_0895 [Furfurilactobacillus rossiae]